MLYPSCLIRVLSRDCVGHDTRYFVPCFRLFSEQYSTDVDVDIGGVLMDSLSLTRSQIEEIGIRALRLGQLQANEIRRFLAKSVGASEVSDVVVDEVFRNSRGGIVDVLMMNLPFHSIL